MFKLLLTLLILFTVLSCDKMLKIKDNRSPAPPEFYFFLPSTITYDESRTKVFLTHKGTELIRFNLTTKNIKVISSMDNANTAQIAAYRETFYDSINKEILAAVTFSDFTHGIIKINENTGVITIISSNVVGTGTNISNPFSLFYSADRTKIYIVNISGDNILEVDVATGNRIYISHSTKGTGTKFSYPYKMCLSQDKTDLYVVDLQHPGVFSVDILTGNRTVISSNAVGTGLAFVSPLLCELGSTSDELFITDQSNNNLYKVSSTTGDRTLLQSDFYRISDITKSRNNSEIIIFDGARNSISKYDTSTQTK